MTEYITKKQMLEYQQYLHGKMPNEENYKLWKYIKELPTADVAPVVHAKWERVYGGSLIDTYKCSHCHNLPPKKQIPELKTWGWDLTDYCPNCGAKMDNKE